ncbi:unnamed protein product, partial [Didymodactylos carnosus]
MAVLVELPPPVREYESNTILLALWHSVVTPDANVLLASVIEQLAVLKAGGLNVHLQERGTTKFDIDIQLCGGDLPARSKCNKLNSHNGFYSCTKCLLKGEKCRHCNRMLYKYKDFQKLRVKDRTQEHINACVRLIEKKNNKNYKPFGVIAKSALSDVISIPNQSVYDYFHLCLEIHVNFLLTQWSLSLQKADIVQSNDFPKC